MLQKLSAGKYYLDYGPVQMTIAAFAEERPLDEEIRQAEQYVGQLLEELAACLDVARRPLTENKQLKKKLPAVLLSMIAAVRAAGDFTLTPMAAVAGAFADAVADFLFHRNATRVIINNGGDIALRLETGESIVVGLNPFLRGGCSHTFRINGGGGCRGIATSGLGGRGFTKGIASAVTVLSHCSSVADACATSIANWTTVDDPGVYRVPAEKLDPQTDIKGQLVTMKVSPLDPQAYGKAVQSGVKRARQLLDEGIISGVTIFAGPYMSILPESFAGQIEWRMEA